MARKPDLPALFVDMDPQMKNALAEVAWRRRTSMSALIRQAAADLIEEEAAAERASQVA